MNPIVDRIARAVLYEGYILYPYRPTSVKNQQRWTFGGIYPRAYSDAQAGTDTCEMQTQCLLNGNAASMLSVRVRFLHLMDRTVEAATGDGFAPVQSLEVNGRTYLPWQEAVERSVELEAAAIGDLILKPACRKFKFPASHTTEPIENVGRLVREQRQIDGVIEVSVIAVDGVYRLSVRVVNETAIMSPSPGTPGEGRGEGDFDRRTISAAPNHPHPNPLPDYRERGPEPTRDAALLCSLVSTHMVLTIENGAFISPTDPPPALQTPAADCKNIGCWPVLVGEPGTTDTLLASPIILYDYPQIAPESPGDLFDGCEIDEILTLRILTMTDDEKRQAAAVDPLAEKMLCRTEALARQQLMNLHGAIRGLRPTIAEATHG